jgi:hypothetical protein
VNCYTTCIRRHRVDAHAKRAAFDLKVFSPSCNDSLPKYRASDLHVGLVERAQDCFDVVLVHLCEELLDRLLGLRTCRVGADRCRIPGRCRRRRRGRLVKEQKLDVSSG